MSNSSEAAMLLDDACAILEKEFIKGEVSLVDSIDEFGRSVSMVSIKVENSDEYLIDPRSYFVEVVRPKWDATQLAYVLFEKCKQAVYKRHFRSYFQ